MKNIPSKAKIKTSYESYKEYFADIINNIIENLQNNIQLSTRPTYKSRVKSFESYYKKILRLKPQEASTTESFVYITDMMGIRMICAFLEDINIAVEQIKKNFDVVEVEVKGADKKFSEFGYESTHVLIKIPESCKPQADKYADLPQITDDIVCEIQIRTILQDAWAEVEHELIYKTEFNPFDLPLRRKLASINASLTLADITFQEIRDYQTKLQQEIANRRHSFYSMADTLLDDKPTETVKDKGGSTTSFVKGTIDEMLLQAIQAHNEGELDRAAVIYSAILDALTEKDKVVNAVIRKHRGMAYFSMNKFDLAVEDFTISIECDPKAFRTYYYRGIVYSIQKLYDKAIEDFSTSLSINNFQSHTYLRRAMAYYEIQEYEKSMNDLDSAINLGMKPEEYKSLQEKLVKKFGMNM
ncbi:MAG: (p)ppGpp synthetase [Treponema sp.]|nr:(p)ppGpp synthetase [Treponema sp.]